jgi:hypothetical protein
MRTQELQEHKARGRLHVGGMLCLWAFLLCFPFTPILALPSSGQMRTGEAEILAAKAASLLQEGKTQEALEFLDQALKKDPHDSEFLFLKAAALNRLGKPEQALEILEALEKKEPSRPGLREEISLARALVGQGQMPRYRVFLESGFEYDSNVRTESDDHRLRRGKDREDGRFVFRGYGEYRVLRGDPWEVGGGLALYTSSHFDLTEYDYHGPTALVWAGYRAGSVLARLRYSYSYFWLDTESYLRQHAPGVEIWWNQAPWAKFGLTYTASKNDYFDPQDLDRDSINHKVGFMEQVQLFRGLWVRFHYYFDRENAQGDDWDWTGHEFGAYGIVALPWELRLEGGASYYRRDFDHRHSIFHEHRNDDRWTFKVELARRILGPMDAILSYTRVNNQSTVSFYEYTRDIVSFRVRVAF